MQQLLCASPMVATMEGKKEMKMIVLGITEVFHGFFYYFSFFWLCCYGPLDLALSLCYPHIQLYNLLLSAEWYQHSLSLPCRFGNSFLSSRLLPALHSIYKNTNPILLPLRIVRLLMRSSFNLGFPR